jgi:two-component system sensor histidine kinase FlrB
MNLHFSTQHLVKPIKGIPASYQDELSTRLAYKDELLTEDAFQYKTTSHDDERIANRLSRILEVMPAGVVVIDGQGIVVESNVTAVSLLGEPLQDQKWVDIIERAFDTNVSNGHDVALKDGRLLHISTSPLVEEPGQILVLNDVTETRQLQQKVSHLQRLSAMGEVAARLAHQIRTPLSSAMLYIAPLMRSDTDSQLQQKFAKKLHASISHMEQLVKNMLAFSRGDMAETSPVAVVDLLNMVEQQFSSQPKAEHYQLEIQNTVNDAYVYGSQEALASAINNLLNNARQACGEEGEITIYSEYVEDDAGTDCIEISIEDNGIGISQQDKEKILKPFYTTRSSGTGLGLAVVNSIVQAHRGELWFESDEGEGSTFSIRLPMYQSAQQFTLKAQKK